MFASYEMNAQLRTSKVVCIKVAIIIIIIITTTITITTISNILTSIIITTIVTMSLPECPELAVRAKALATTTTEHVIVFFACSARATHDARCFSIGLYLIGKGNGQMRVTEGTLPLSVKPVIIVHDGQQLNM